MEHRKMYPAKYATFIAMKLDEIDAAIAHGQVPEFGLDDVEGDVEVSMVPVEMPDPLDVEQPADVVAGWGDPRCHVCGHLPRWCACVIPAGPVGPHADDASDDLPY